MPHFSIGTFGMTVAVGEVAFERGVIVMHENKGRRQKAESRRAKGGSLFKTLLPSAFRLLPFKTSGCSNNDDQHGHRADQNPDPFLAGEAGGIQLIQVLRELMQILIRKLRDLLVDLFLCQAM